MSASMLQWAFDADLPPDNKMLLVALAWACEDNNPEKPDTVCWPHIKTLMRRAGYRSERSIYEHLAQIEQAGFICRYRHDGRTYYALQFGVPAPAEPSPVPPAPPPEPEPEPEPEPLRADAQAELFAAPPCSPTAPPRKAALEAEPPAAAYVRSHAIAGKKSTSKKESPQKTPLRGVQKPPQVFAVQPQQPTDSDSRGRPIPLDWDPGERGATFARDLGLDPQGTFDAFRDYWLAAAGVKRLKRDWDATWRVWCRKDAEQARRSPRWRGSEASAFADPPESEADLAAIEARLKAENRWFLRPSDPGYGIPQ